MCQEKEGEQVIKCFITASKLNKQSFTLVELIIVVIIVGILASLGLTQYNLVVERSRTTEAKARIGVMRNLACAYYFEHGSFDALQGDDVGAESGCNANSYYWFRLGTPGSDYIRLVAERCTSGGKPPNASLKYYYFLQYYPGTGQSKWCCFDADNAACFGLPHC